MEPWETPKTVSEYDEHAPFHFRFMKAIVLALLAPISQNGQTHSNLPMNCLSVFDQFVDCRLKV